MESMLSYVGQNYASPAYKRHAEYWRFLRASYLGGRAWYDQGNTASFTPTDPAATTHHTEHTIKEQAYLARHMREPDAFYQLRFRASVYWNFMRPLVDGMASAVAAQAITTKVPAVLSYITSNVDGQRADIADFDRDCLVDLIRYGVVHIMGTKPTAPVQVNSLADERDLGLVPYARIVSPIDLLRWSWDPQKAEYRWAIVRERVPAEIPMLITGDGDQGDEPDRYQFRLLAPQGWILFSQDGKELDAGGGNGFVPLSTTVREQHPLEAEPIGVSLVEDVAELAKLVYNKFSWLTEEQRAHCFNQWFLKGKDRLTANEQVAFGSATYVGGFEDAKILSPSVAPMEHLEESLMHDIKRRARGILGMEWDESEASGVKSGLAISLERAETEATLSGLAKQYETAKRRWLMMLARMAGADPNEVEVKVDRDFGELAALARQDQILTTLKDANLPPQAKAVLQKELLHALLPNITADERQRLDTIIDEEAGKSDAPTEPTETGDGQGDEEVKMAADEGDDEAVDPNTALNGAQVSSLTDIIAAVAERRLPRETGVAIITAAFPVSATQADTIMGSVGDTFFVESANAAPAPGGPPEPPVPPKPMGEPEEEPDDDEGEDVVEGEEVT